MSTETCVSVDGVWIRRVDTMEIRPRRDSHDRVHGVKNPKELMI
jgi:hypothetical protein